MRYLAIHINYDLDPNWYARFDSVLDCYKYFDSLGKGDGPRVAVYDMETQKYLWLSDDHQKSDPRLNEIVKEAVSKLKLQQMK